jgi:hypothetical protein
MNTDRAAGTPADHRLDESWELAVCKTLLHDMTRCHGKNGCARVEKKCGTTLNSLARAIAEYPTERSGHRRRELNFGFAQIVFGNFGEH